MANRASDQYFNIELGGAPFYVVACDGNPVPEMFSATRFLLAPASRVEILVTGAAVGETAFTSRQIRTGPAGDGYAARSSNQTHAGSIKHSRRHAFTHRRQHAWNRLRRNRQ
ncbi:MAG: hypothetical protein DWI10_10425 [Planctomycetota bacterium]|nr:MAG: hypothetical protein DWI10_10425 [Planctomycetota bacterium]